MNLTLIKNSDGTCDIAVVFSADEPEFGLDMLSSKGKKRCTKSITEYIREKSDKVKIRTVKFIVAGVLVAIIPFASLMGANAAAQGKYSMGYLYFGTPAQQIEFVNRTNNSLNTVSPSIYDINTDGSIKINTISKTLVDQMHSQDIKVVPFLSNHWDRTAGVNMLNNIEKSASLIADSIAKNNLDGINVDIENVTVAERVKYVEFVRVLRNKIPAGKEVSVAVAANPYGWTTGWQGSYDYEGLGKYADHLFIMAYDESYQGGPQGPVASISFVENSIKYALGKVQPSKIVLGLPLYGRIWSDSGFNGEGAGISKIEQLIKDYSASTQYNTTVQSAKATFIVKDGSKENYVNGKLLNNGYYTVWYETEESVAAKLKLVEKYGLKGAGTWALGQETDSIWDAYSEVLNGQPLPPKDTGSSGAASSSSSGTTSQSTSSKSSSPGQKDSKSTSPKSTSSKSTSSKSTSSTASQNTTSSKAAASSVSKTNASGKKLSTSSVSEAGSPDSRTQEEAVEAFKLQKEITVDNASEDMKNREEVFLGTVKKDGTSVFSEPNEKNVTATLGAGTVIALLSMALGYYKIRKGNINGYVKQEEVEKSKMPDEVYFNFEEREK